MKMKRYTELIRIPTFEERFYYLRMYGCVGASTFGFDRYLNQTLYRSRRWRRLRDQIIIRDEGFDLGLCDYPIADRAIVHHMNPISPEDIENESEDIFNSDFLILTSLRTHQAIHYGDESLLPQKPVERYKGDTCLW